MKEVSDFDKQVEAGVRDIIKAFGKGEDLRGAVSLIVDRSARWGYDNAKNEGKENAK